MACQQPTRRVARRVPPLIPASLASEAQPPTLPLTQSRDESQTWVLFSPATDAGTITSSYLSSAQDDQPTPGRSRISDLGSLQTIAHADSLYSEHANSDILDDGDAVEDDAELDSLDSHLPEFLHRGLNRALQSTTILPGHDGLGTFRLDTRGLLSEMQEAIYQFERYNPRTVKRRREGLELGRLAPESEEAQEAARRRRIEDWRLEQSRILLQEIQKETRRRRESTASALMRKSRITSQVSAEAAAEETAMSMTADPTPDASMAGTEWHDQDASEPHLAASQGEEGSRWSQITRQVMRDLMGIDDKLLCVLFGDALTDDLDLEMDHPSTTPKADTPVPAGNLVEAEASWQLRVLDRIDSQLGDLVNQLSAHPHPGAFSTYMRTQQIALPYVGLPVIPEVVAVPAQVPRPIASPPSVKVDSKHCTASWRTSTVAAVPQFQPTLYTIPHDRPMDMLGARSSDVSLQTAGAEKVPGTFSQQEWEQDLDVKLVFRYLRNRFTSSRVAAASSAQFSLSQLQAHAASSSQDAAARAAARVRQQHPLVRGVKSNQRRPSFKLNVASGTASQLVRHTGSCASQSTRKRGRRGSMSVSSRQSSRHFWDLGVRDGAAASIGTGSLIASTGPMGGSWGEV